MSFIQPTTLHLCVCENVVPTVDGNDHGENDCLKHKKIWWYIVYLQTGPCAKLLHIGGFFQCQVLIWHFSCRTGYIKAYLIGVMLERW